MKKKEKEIGIRVEQLALKIGDEKVFTHRNGGRNLSGSELSFRIVPRIPFREHKFSASLKIWNWKRVLHNATRAKKNERDGTSIVTRDDPFIIGPFRTNILVSSKLNSDRVSSLESIMERNGSR